MNKKVKTNIIADCFICKLKGDEESYRFLI